MTIPFGCVTTFSPEGYEQYGRRFLDSYVKHWDVPLWVYYEGKTPPELVHEEGRVHWMPLDADKDRAKFMQRHSDEGIKDYRFQIVRFAHKIFALTDPERIKEVECENWIWLDADIETTEKVDEAFLDEVCPGGFCGSYLGRVDWHHSECGFVSYSKRYGGVEFLSELRKIYTSGKILDYDEHHDSFIFDQIRKGWWFNLSEGLPGMHVFDDSALGTKMKHYKGPARKKGGAVPGDENYMSQKEARAMHKAIAGKEILDAKMGKSQEQLIVKTKNCVQDKNIDANIHYFATLVEDYVVECEPHDAQIIFCSGGPSLKGFLPEIKKLSKRKDHYVVCVKHAHDVLIEYGIVPWACVLLDPRGHVVDFIENPHPEVNYFVSSMVHPTTIDRLIKESARIWGYHAHVGANEIETVKMRLGKKHFLLGGGCSTAMRGLSVLNCLGFCRFNLYGYDLCYAADDPEVDYDETDKRGQKKYFEVEVMGRKFITDAEKIAQAQDFTKIMKEKQIRLQVFGDGMVPHIWRNRDTKPDFREVFA